MTLVWRWMLGMMWCTAIFAMASIWQASVQIGQSTWWVGPRGDTQPVLVQLIPFYGPVAMVLLILLNARRLAWAGIAAALPIGVFGVIDRGRFTSIGNLEIAIAVALVVASALSAVGVYRR